MGSRISASGAWRRTKDPDRRTGYAAHCSELLRQLARALGVLALHNPEPSNHVVAVPPLPELLDQIAASAGFALEAPLCPSYYGLDTPPASWGSAY